MLEATVLDTDDFLRWIAGGPAADRHRHSAASLRKSLAERFCAIVYTSEEGVTADKGVALVVDEARYRDFFAFVSTYVTEYTPFTAYYRVLSTGHLDLLDADPDFGFVDERQFRRLIGFTGVAIAEAAIYMQGRGYDEGKGLNVSTVMASYSAAVLQGLFAGPAVDIAEIGRRWAGFRSIMGGERLSLPPERLDRFWEVVRAAFYSSDPGARGEDRELIVRNLRRAFDTGRVDDELLFEFLERVPELNLKLSRLRGPREERARAIREAVGVLSDSQRIEGDLRDAVVGLLLSILGDGSFKFLSLALSTASVLPMAPMWFAAWSGVQRSTDMMTFNNCLGRRLVRDLYVNKDPFGVPVDDISLDELQIAAPHLEALPRAFPNSLSVEIYPNVSSRQSLQKPANSATQTLPDLTGEVLELRRLLAQSSAVLAKIEDVTVQRTSARTPSGSTRSGGGRKPRF